MLRKCELPFRTKALKQISSFTVSIAVAKLDQITISYFNKCARWGCCINLSYIPFTALWSGSETKNSDLTPRTKKSQAELCFSTNTKFMTPIRLDQLEEALNSFISAHVWLSAAQPDPTLLLGWDEKIFVSLLERKAVILYVAEATYRLCSASSGHICVGNSLWGQLAPNKLVKSDSKPGDHL